jgi:hypothetical protein
MPTFKLNSQKEINEDYQGINISQFTYSNAENVSEEFLIDLFFHSKSFTEESIREIIKNDTENRPFLRQAFEIDLIKMDDFKQTDKNKIIEFLNDYGNTNDWGDTDGDNFIKLKDKFLEFLTNVKSNNFYLISKEWFDENSEKVREPENWIYSYYFLIIWIDEIDKILTVSEWTYD